MTEAVTASDGPTIRPAAPGPPPRRRSPPWERLPSGAWTALLLIGFLAFWRLGAGASWWPEAIVPSLTDVMAGGLEEIRDGEFYPHLWATVGTTLLAHIAGTLLGAAAGVLFWRAQRLGRMFEPYLVSFYTVPLVVFYPVALVVLGINRWPIVILAAVMALIPMTLNTWVGLSGIPPVYLQLARSLCASRRDLFLHVAIPAAAPVLHAGATLAAVYALVGVVAMEFMMSQVGLGSRIRYLYEAFDNPGMYFSILATLVVSVLIVGAVNAATRSLLALGRRAA